MNPTDHAAIIAALRRPHRSYDYRTVQAAMAAGPALIPGLLALLEEVLTWPLDDYRIDWTEHNAHVYAAVLLGYLREPRAHVPLLKIFTALSAADEIDDTDVLPECFPYALWQTAAGSPAALLAMIDDRDLDTCARFLALHTMMFAVAEDGIGSSELADYCATSLSREMQLPPHLRDDESVLLGCIDIILDLHPREHETTLRRAIEVGLVHHTELSEEQLAAAVADSPARRRAEMLFYTRGELAVTPHELLKGLSCWQENIQFYPRAHDKPPQFDEPALGAISCWSPRVERRLLDVSRHGVCN